MGRVWAQGTNKEEVPEAVGKNELAIGAAEVGLPLHFSILSRTSFRVAWRGLFAPDCQHASERMWKRCGGTRATPEMILVQPWNGFAGVICMKTLDLLTGGVCVGRLAERKIGAGSRQDRHRLSVVAARGRRTVVPKEGR